MRGAEPGVVSEEWRTFLHIAMDVSREYQRALWHSLSANGRPDVRINASVRTDRLGRRSERTVTSTEFTVDVGLGTARAIEEWHFHKYGRISVLMLDIQGSILSHWVSGANSIVQQPLLSLRQREALAMALKDKRTQVIVLASDVPFALEPSPDVHESGSRAGPGSPLGSPVTVGSPAAVGSPSGAGGRFGSLFDWRMHRDELHELLESLFQWKNAQYPYREVVLVSCGPGFGTTGDICDHHLGLSIPTVITGPVLGRVCASTAWSLQGSIAGGRFSYSYSPPSDRWNFCSIDVDLAAHKPAVDLQLVGIPVPLGASWADGP